jgi:hypothetical protein
MRANFGEMTQHRFARDRNGRTLLRLVGLWTLIGCFVRLTRHSLQSTELVRLGHGHRLVSREKPH